jgi:hypothetical protein
MKPTLAGFILFVRNVMQIPSGILPDNATVISSSYDYAIATVNQLLLTVELAYQNAVYNLAGDILINFGQDITPSTVFADIRTAYKINSFVPGFVSSTSDNGTSTSLETPDFFRELTLSDLQLMKTPYGRAYLAIAQKAGGLWGITT